MQLSLKGCKHSNWDVENSLVCYCGSMVLDFLLFFFLRKLFSGCPISSARDVTKDLYSSCIVSTSSGCKVINMMQSCLPEFEEVLNKSTFLHLSEFSWDLMISDQKPVVLYLSSTSVMQLDCSNNIGRQIVTTWTVFRTSKDFVPELFSVVKCS